MMRLLLLIAFVAGLAIGADCPETVGPKAFGATGAKTN